ncbi:MAG TPA: choice-of-anchor tandem repeat GloVer-containing protein [Stellaceae bacterium]|nr:choice-of-anchor tandem repeat GloVer-containing protein [Stellaceae bacterium]
MRRFLSLPVFAVAVLAASAAAHASRFTTLYTFCPGAPLVPCAAGSQPSYLLLEPDATPGAPVIFGITQLGGAAGQGVAFELLPNETGTAYRETVLYNFCSLGSCTDGALPVGTLLKDSLGDLYGTTAGGGANGEGTIFELIPGTGGYSDSILYSFCSLANCADGRAPEWLIAPGNGELYGVTGGDDLPLSTVFAFSASGGESVLHSFPFCRSHCLDGVDPTSVVFATGELYGSTCCGGAHLKRRRVGLPVGGVVFKLSLDGGESILYNFCSVSHCADGNGPGPLLVGKRGRLYGVTSAGGAHGKGAVFMISRTGTEEVLYDFCTLANCADGAEPSGGLVSDAHGNLYGITNSGGAPRKAGGTVFELVRGDTGGQSTYTERVLYSFSLCPFPEGAASCQPVGLAGDASGNLYGATMFGGGGVKGTVFKIDPQN